MSLGHGDFIVPSFLLDRKVIFTFSAFSIDIILPMLQLCEGVWNHGKYPSLSMNDDMHSPKSVIENEIFLSRL